MNFTEIRNARNNVVIDEILKELQKQGYDEFTRKEWRKTCNKITKEGSWACNNFLDLAEKRGKITVKNTVRIYEVVKKERKKHDKSMEKRALKKIDSKKEMQKYDEFCKEIKKVVHKFTAENPEKIHRKEDYLDFVEWYLKNSSYPASSVEMVEYIEKNDLWGMIHGKRKTFRFLHDLLKEYPEKFKSATYYNLKTQLNTTGWFFVEDIEILGEVKCDLQTNVRGFKNELSWKSEQLDMKR